MPKPAKLQPRKDRYPLTPRFPRALRPPRRFHCRLAAMVMRLAVMAVRGSVRHGRELHRHAHDLAVAHAALGDDMLAELLHVGGVCP